MNAKVLKTLEFNKILEQLSRFASSDAGAFMCRNLEPSTDLEAITTAQIQTTDAVTRLRKKHGPNFGNLPDIRPSIKRLEISSPLSTTELLEISLLLDAAESVRKFLRPETDETPLDSLSSYYEALDSCPMLNDEIKRCIISYDEIADDASPKLKDIRRHMGIAKDQIQRTLNRILSSSTMKPYLQDSLVTMRNGRYCIPVKNEHRAHVDGMIHDQSGSGSTVFIEPAAVVNLNNQLKELDLAEQAEIQVILEHLSNQAGAVRKNLAINYDLLVELDFIFAKARYSESIHGNAPEFNDKGIVDLKQARHPLLAVKNAVPISVNIGRDFNMLIVTGPNTGGKTVSLKTVGLLCLMGQAGLHIPAFDGSTLCIFNEIYADIGDEQSIEQSLSTFSSHMKNIVEILDKADSDSLVLLDELCSGTDPTEGAALAQSILTRLLYFGSKVMATTHYSELKVFAISTEGVQNACCEFDVETLRPTYKLLIGLPGKSNAFAISGKLGLDERIINDARTRIDQGNVAFEDLLANIEIDKKTAELERNEAAAAKAKATALMEKLEREKEEFDRKKKSILREANEEAYSVLQQAKDYADMAIKDIRKAEKGSINLSALERTRTEVGRKAKDSLEKLSFKPEKQAATKAFTAEQVKVGDAVHVNSMNMDGVVTSGPDSKNTVGIQFGSMNMQVKLSDLSQAAETMETVEKTTIGKHGFVNGKSKGGKKLEGSNIGNIKYEKALGVSTELKILGLTVDEAVIELSKYIDDASMAHIEKVRIVHGKGTGALRTAVWHYLKRDKRVKKYYQAEYGEGDAGVTIAELK
ncbi:MAG: endonuclease MutS2 [Lachnospiraceae bacterium]|nr:endonuclease MutS2 [Lachnospiraceae bacterium]